MSSFQDIFAELISFLNSLLPAEICQIVLRKAFAIPEDIKWKEVLETRTYFEGRLVIEKGESYYRQFSCSTCGKLDVEYLKIRGQGYGEILRYKCNCGGSAHWLAGEYTIENFYKQLGHFWHGKI